MRMWSVIARVDATCKTDLPFVTKNGMQIMLAIGRLVVNLMFA